jgi:hypothetical protein
MRGEFQTGPLSSLSEDALNFVKVFLSARGNLTEVERVLGISYPTIRNKLDEINNVLNRAGDTANLRDKPGAAANEDTVKTTEEMRKEILQKVADGRLSAAEAVKQLKDIQG